jgi:anti-sigma factor RsiW
MSISDTERQALISGYLDGELDASERAAFEAELERDPELRSELEEMRSVVRAADALEFEVPPDEDWDAFAETVLSRTERRTGWLLLFLGALVIGAFGLYYVAFRPWAPFPIRMGVEVIGVGGLVLFGSVLRHRIYMRKSDRYSRDVRR